MWESVNLLLTNGRTLSVKQTLAIVFRETSFLFSLRISSYMTDAMKPYSGDSKAVQYSTAFTSGAIGSVVGHPADTALTIWQKGMKITCLKQTMKGAPIKALTVGCFSVLFKLTKNIFQSLGE